MRPGALLLAAALLAPPVTSVFAHISGSPAESRKKAGRALLTFYWLIDESSERYQGKRDAVLLDIRGKVIARTHSRFRRDLVMEGSGWLRDGRTVMFHKKVGGKHRFRISTAKYGVSSMGCSLKPYRTVAVDPKFVRLGSTISIPQLKGAVLPDGTVHDGIFTATDRGQFKGAHIDLFVGAGPTGSRPFARRGYPSRSRVTVYITDAPLRRSCH